MASSNLYSEVYIKSSGGAKIYMDLEPAPKPVLNGERSSDRISIKGTYMDKTTVDQIWVLYMTFADIYVNINDGAGEYLCRWADGEGFKPFKEGGKKSYSYELNFVVLSTRTSQVIIADSNGSNPITLDFNPYPFPEPVKQKNGTATLEIETAYITRAHADSILSKFPNDVRVTLSTGGVTYICRWNESGCQIIPTHKNNLSARFSFVVLTTTTSSASGTIVIGSVTLDVNPSPYPTIRRTRKVSSEVSTPGLSGTTPTAAQTVHFDGGTHISDGTIEFEVAYLSEAKITSIQAIYDTYSTTTISLNGGTTTNTVIFEDFEVIREGNTATSSAKCRFRFKVVS